MSPDKNISMLFKGPPGEGKTIAAASFAVFGPVFLAYFDKQKPIELLTFFKKHRPELLDNIDYEVYSSKNAYEFHNKLVDFTNNGCRYLTVILDSVTNFTSAAVNWSLAFRTGATKDKDAKQPGFVPQFIPDFDEYKVETSMITQALDMMKLLPIYNIWTAHPLPKMEISGAGRSMTITKSTSIVSYGQKVGALVPGQFTEIYHFAREVDYQTTPTTTRRLILTDDIGEDFAKTSIGLPAKFDVTNKLFAEVWAEEVKKVHDGFLPKG